MPGIGIKAPPPDHGTAFEGRPPTPHRAIDPLIELGRDGWRVVHLVGDNTMEVPHRTNRVCAFFSNKVLHLLSEIDFREATLDAITRMETGAYFCVSARSADDFNPALMEWIPGKSRRRRAVNLKIQREADTA
jgi:hypothetical protein